MAHNFFAIWATREAASKCINKAKALNTVTSLLRSLRTWGYKHKMVLSLPVIAPFTFPCSIFLLAQPSWYPWQTPYLSSPWCAPELQSQSWCKPCAFFTSMQTWAGTLNPEGRGDLHPQGSPTPARTVSWLLSWLSCHVDLPKWVDSSWHVDSPAWPLMTSYLGSFL